MSEYLKSQLYWHKLEYNIRKRALYKIENIMYTQRVRSYASWMYMWENLKIYVLDNTPVNYSAATETVTFEVSENKEQ